MANGLLSSLSLGDLLGRLHSSISGIISSLDRVIEVDKGVSTKEISELRNRITDRIREGQEPVENKKLLAVLNLLVVNENAVTVMRQEADEWLEFIDVIEKRLGGKNALTDKERKELDQISGAISDIRGTLRRD